MRKSVKTIMICLLMATMLTAVDKSDACTRVVYKGPNGTIITARSMDFSMEYRLTCGYFQRVCNATEKRDLTPLLGPPNMEVLLPALGT